jgi:hypothetical protein
MRDKEISISISMASVLRNGQVVKSISANGKTTRQMERAGSSMLMEISMPEISFMTNLTEMVYTFMLIRPNTSVNGKTICSTAKVSKAGQIAQSMLEAISSARRVAKASTIGLMVHNLKEIGSTTQSADVESTNGKMEDSTLATGKATAWMVMVFIPGLMAEAMQVSM